MCASLGFVRIMSKHCTAVTDGDTSHVIGASDGIIMI